MIQTMLVEQHVSYEPVAHVLSEKLDLIQNIWCYKIISITETKVCKSPRCSDQGFIILYDDGKDVVKKEADNV